MGLRTIYDEAKFPYWVLTDEKTVLGLIVVAQEPRELIQPAGKKFVQIHLFTQNPEAVTRLANEAQKISEKHGAAFLGCVIDAEHTSIRQPLEKAGMELFDESYKMVCPLESITFPESELEFYRTMPEDANLVLTNLVPIMQGSPDSLMQASIRNITRLPSELLNPMLSQMEVIFARKHHEIIGLLSFTGPTISMIGVLPNERGKGYGRNLTQWAKAHLAQNGHIRALLRVSVDNKPAIHIYETEGFRVTNQIQYFLKKYPPHWKNNTT